MKLRLPWGKSARLSSLPPPTGVNIGAPSKRSLTETAVNTGFPGALGGFQQKSLRH
jgi:hypothetical protein